MFHWALPSEKCKTALFLSNISKKRRLKVLHWQNASGTQARDLTMDLPIIGRSYEHKRFGRQAPALRSTV